MPEWVGRETGRVVNLTSSCDVHGIETRRHACVRDLPRTVRSRVDSGHGLLASFSRILSVLLISCSPSAAESPGAGTTNGACEPGQSRETRANIEAVPLGTSHAEERDSDAIGRGPEPCTLAADAWATNIDVAEEDCRSVLRSDPSRLRVVGRVGATVEWEPDHGLPERILVSDTICRVPFRDCAMPLERSGDGWRLAGPCVQPSEVPVAEILHRRLRADDEALMGASELATNIVDVAGRDVVSVTSGAGRDVYESIRRDPGLIPLLVRSPDPLAGQLVDVSGSDYLSAVSGLRGIANVAGAHQFHACGCRDERLADRSYALACSVAWQMYLERENLE